jgi:hypothetical protein
MRVDINPFYTRASDNIDTDERFIKLFSPEILSVFRDFPIWNAVNVLRSSPGGGKTTLLKIFSPKVLNEIKGSRAYDNHAKELFQVLKELGIFDDKGNPLIAAGITAFNTQYTTLEYLNINETQKIRLFCALLNIRILLSAFKSLCEIKDLNYPKDLQRFTFNGEESPEIPVQLRQLQNGKELYTWASNEEEKICDQIDSIYLDISGGLKGVDTLYALDFLSPQNLKLDDKKLDTRIVVMLDDVHNLSANQRNFLIKTIINKRPQVNVWISERLKALTMEELLSEGSKNGRDTNIIELERFWANRNVQFEKFAKSVANKRVEIAFENKKDFASLLSEHMSTKYQTIITDAQADVIARIKQKYGNIPKYDSWIKSKEELADIDDFDRLLEWRALEILLFRDRNKSQQTLAFDDLDVGELEYQQGNDVKIAAHLFVHDQYKIPFYYGISTICRLASSNIEQFLNIAGELFDVVLDNKVLNIVNSSNKLILAPEKQEDVIRKMVSQSWKDMDANIPNYEDVKKLLDAIGEFCHSETFVPNAWNSPGINGIAITMTERNDIKNTYLKDSNHHYHRIAKCLSLCIAYNLIDFKLGYKCKGKEWMILYLNRIYCTKYKLPLNNGKFKEKKVKDLAQWLNSGVTNQRKLKV